MTVAVVDFGGSNLRSVAKALAHAGAKRVVVTNDPDEIRAAAQIVFPGQGAIGSCVENLRKLDLLDCLREAMRDKPVLGICLGLQALFERSEEDEGSPGLGLLPGRVVRFTRTEQDRVKIPHMGWNQVRQDLAHPLWKGIPHDTWFYFVHSYYVVPGDPRLVAGTTTYGRTAFASVVASGNVFAMQFHPEKSHQAGLDLLRNFISWSGAM